jgi:DNA-binding helix-hairpin-helix protein with protein kinase domain
MQRPQLVDSHGRTVRLGREIGRGGEGVVFEIDGDTSVAKLYLQPLSQEKIDKLTLMASQASDGIRGIAAWPTELLREASRGTVQGFLMPKVTGYKPVHLLYGVQSRRNEFPKATWEFLAGAALNAASAFSVLHKLGHVIGDVNENNVLVSPKDYTVALIDCDSFQVRSPTAVFRCEVGVPLYTPPELQGRSLSQVERTLNHDRFGLALKEA